MKILVTGGAGFIGSHVVDAYLEAGHEVAVLDDFSTGKPHQVPTGVRLFQGSVADKNLVQTAIAEFAPEIVNHHAAQISVTASVQEPLIDTERNVQGTVTVLEAARRSPSVRKVIYAASGGSMYGNPRQLPCDEETPGDPLSPYALSKQVAERYVWLYTRISPLKATVLRYSNVYGPRQDPHGEAGVCAIFAPRMMQGEPVTIFGNGAHVRDYVYVSDVAAANLAALEKGDGQAFHIATGVGTTTQEVFTALKEAIGYNLEATQAPERPGEVQKIILSIEKAKQQLGWQPQVPFNEGVRRTVAWYREA